MNQRTPLTRRKLLRAAIVAGGTVLSYEGPVKAVEIPAAKAGLPQVKPEDIRIDPKRLQVAYDLMEKWTTGPNAAVPGGAILVGRFGKAVVPRLFGRQGPEADAEPIRRDAMFYMASVTKPVIYTGGDAPRRARPAQSQRPGHALCPRVYRRRARKQRRSSTCSPTRRDCRTSCRTMPSCGGSMSPLKKFIEGSIEAELLFKPGTRFSYSSSATILVAEIVQRLSGRSIQEFVRREIIEPLGLKSTGLGSQGFARERLVRTTVPDYQVAPSPAGTASTGRSLARRPVALFSTPEDFAVICALMLGGGKWGDVRLLSPATVRMMTSNRLNDLPDLPEPVRRTQPWGLGWRLNHLGMPDSWSDLLDRHVFGHTGSAGNVVWMDPRTQGFCIVFTNYLRARAPWRLVHLSNAIAAAFV